jgi:hypothetical protein
MAPVDAFAFTRRGELLAAVRPRRFVHPVAHRPVKRLGQNERLFHERPEQLEGLVLVELVSADDRARSVDRHPFAEHTADTKEPQ